MPNSVNDLKDRALDVWRRAPTVVIACGIVLVLLCSTCCLCSGCLPGGGDGEDETAEPQQRTQAGTGLTISEFEAEVKDKVLSKSGFFRTYGPPDRTTEIGVFTFLHYTCEDGRVKVKCRKAAFEDDDEVSTVAVERE